MKNRKTNNSKDAPQCQKRLNSCASKKSCQKTKWQQQVYSSSETIVDKLNSMKSYGKKDVIWRLNSKSKALIEEAGFVLEPFLYSVRTRSFPTMNLKNSPGLIKRLHGASKSGKQYITLKPTRKDMEVIRKHGISYKVMSYRILLN